MTPTSRAIQQAVVAWHNRHPLAARIDESQVHSIGWVALPFLRPPQGVEPTMDGSEASGPAPSPATPTPKRRPWERLVRAQRATNAPWPVFSEAFIDGISASRAARFAAAHGLSVAPQQEGEDEGERAWPQRRIDVDGPLAERSGGGWPVELWLISAAIDVGKERRRVLVAADGSVVDGPRHWHRRRLQGLWVLTLVAAAAGAAGWWSSRPVAPETSEASAPPSAATVASAPASAAAGPEPASGPTAPPPTEASAPPTTATAASGLPQAPATAASTATAAASAAAVSASGTNDEPPPDIRPQLVKPLPNRRGPPPPPMLASKATVRAEAGSAPPTPGPAPTDAARNATGPSGAETSSGAYRGAATPESIRPGVPAKGPLIALVSPAWKTRAEAEAMLARMTEHLKATMAQQAGLHGEVIETPEGWRAAVYPFATREEAAILNATMVARGWRTRSVSF